MTGAICTGLFADNWLRVVQGQPPLQAARQVRGDRDRLARAARGVPQQRPAGRDDGLGGAAPDPALRRPPGPPRRRADRQRRRLWRGAGSRRCRRRSRRPIVDLRSDTGTSETPSAPSTTRGVADPRRLHRVGDDAQPRQASHHRRPDRRASPAKARCETAARTHRMRPALHVRRLHADGAAAAPCSAPSSPTTSRRRMFEVGLAAAACHSPPARSTGTYDLDAVIAGRPPRRLAGGAGCRPQDGERAGRAAPRRAISASPIPGRSSRTRRAGTSSISTRTCRCKDLKNGIADGYDDIELLKRYSTVGMGPSPGQAFRRHRRARRRRGDRPRPRHMSVTTQRPPLRAGEVRPCSAGRVFDPERRTAMHHRHLELGAQMMPAGVWWRPAYYGTQGRPRAGDRATR